MGLLDFWAKRSKPWEIVFQETPAHPVVKTQPSDRTSAMGWLIGGWEQNWIIREVHFCGKPITRTQLQDLAADAHVMVTWMQYFESQGTSIEQALVTGRNLPELDNRIVHHAAYRMACALKINQSDALEIMVRRTARGV